MTGTEVIDPCTGIVSALVLRSPELAGCAEDILAGAGMLIEGARRGVTILSCGNGGSAADADHLVAELMKGFLLPRPLAESDRQRLETTTGPAAGLSDRLQRGIRAISLASNVALLTAILNDLGPDAVFAQQVVGYGKAGDVLICLSTSGSSRNVVAAASTAKAMGLATLALTGPGGGLLKDICDVSIRVPGNDSGQIQDAHRPVIHALCACVESVMFG
ncbi:MAG: phosphoheptose isomerase [Spirochaetae bacterium HGW-Spirochaetae-7]|jgi:phosphoheptose isomerase|nr:MAG: phosphoheptose isomerase [Spirochaetae bacterium HGW-Spirochaetae-7]